MINRLTVLAFTLLQSVFALRAATAGSVDPSFNIGSGPNSLIGAVVALPDNKVLVGGSFTAWDNASADGLARLLPNGSRDSSFTSAGGSDFDPNRLWVQPDGKILAAGYFNSFAGQPRTNLVRLLENGGLDTSFVAHFNNSVYDIAMLADGRLLVVGAFSVVNSVARPGMVLLQPNGEVDLSFNPEPRITGFGESAHILPDGRFLVAGSTWSDGFHFLFGLLRLDRSGAVDKSFNFGDTSFFADEIFAADGNSLIIQSAFHPARILANDSLDQNYTNGSGSTFSRILALQPDGRHLVAGSSIKDALGNPSSLIRLFADGRIDPSFRTELEGTVSHAVVRPDGLIVIAGSLAEPGQFRTSTLFALHANDPTAPAQIQWQAAAGEAPHIGAVILKLLRDGNRDVAHSVSWSSEFDPALIQVTPAAGAVQFEPGADFKTIEVALTSRPDVTTSVNFRLAAPPDLALGTNQVFTLQVTNQTGTLELTSTALNAAETHGTFSFMVRRSGPLNSPATAGWRITGPTPPDDDLPATSGYANIPAKADHVFVTLRTREDALPEPSRTYALEIFDADADWRVTGNKSASITMADNDLPGYPGRGADNSISGSLLLADGQLLLQGTFEHINGFPAARLARLNPAGDLDRDFALELNGNLSDLYELPDRKILLTGNFTEVNGSPRQYFARLLPDGELDAGFVPRHLFSSVPDEVVSTSDGQYLLAGSYSNFNGSSNGTNLGMIVRLDSTGAKDNNFVTHTTGGLPVGLAPLSNGQFYAFGNIGAYSNAVRATPPFPPFFRQGIIRFNSDGTVDPAFKVTLPNSGVISVPPGTSPPGVMKLHVYPDGTLLASGSFSNINSRATPGLVRLSATGELDLPFLTNVTAALGASTSASEFTVLPDGDIIVVIPPNRFQSQSTLRRLAADGSSRGTIATAAISQPVLHTLPDGGFVLTGAFTVINNQPRYRLAWFNADGTLRPEPFATFQSITRTGQSVELTVYSLLNTTAALQQSSNLEDWSTIQNLSLTPGPQKVSLPQNTPATFYRVLR